MMLGNSLKSDVLPVLEMGCYGVHVPFHTIWEHERIDHQVVHEKFIQVNHANELLPILLTGPSSIA
jgi:putative hydrolase of the HAD superfamily